VVKWVPEESEQELPKRLVEKPKARTLQLPKSITLKVQKEKAKVPIEFTQKGRNNFLLFFYFKNNHIK